MTCVTFSTEFTAMNVLSAMTFDAVVSQTNGRAHGCSMAGRTLEAVMRAMECEIGLDVVIETPEFPAVGVVAVFTFRA